VPLPDDVEPQMLDVDARKELRTLSRETSDLVARHLVMTGRLLDDDAEQALAHARAARALAGRVGVVREAAGLAAYAAGEWAEALSDLRAARRITGEAAHLAVCADCERALGRPERALAYAEDPDVAGLPQEQRVELIIVLAGARRDLGQQDAAVLVLQEPARRTTDKRPWAARLWYAYADALLDAGRQVDAAEWFVRAAAVDVDGETDAGDRLLELQGVVMEDSDDDGLHEEERDDLPTAEQLADLVRDLPVPVASEDDEPPAGAASPRVHGPAAGDDEPPAQAWPRVQGTAAPTGSAEDEPAEASAPAAQESARSVSSESSGRSPGREGRAPAAGLFVSPAGANDTDEDAVELGSPPQGDRTATDVSTDQPEPVVPARGRVAAPTFVAPPPPADEDLD
jgi:tetratricopeptide (TPR) repeat protein